jgi:hypothetical protein
MAWLPHSLWQHLTSFKALLLLIPLLGYFIWKYQKWREAKFLAALSRRERIARRLLET